VDSDSRGAKEGYEVWERHAVWWQEGFTGGADSEYEEQLIPLAADLLGGFGRILDLGCGEGQVARRLASGSSATRVPMVVGADPTHAQAVEAVRRGGGPTYLRASADAIPFADGCFDAVLACLVFEHIESVDEAVAEVSRVLEDGGRFVLFLNHPLIQTPDSGWVDDHLIDPPEQYWRIGPYLLESIEIEEVDRGIHLPFVHRPVSRYVNCLADHGLVLRRMHEPRPADGFLARAMSHRKAATVPRLLVLVSERDVRRAG